MWTRRRNLNKNKYGQGSEGEWETACGQIIFWVSPNKC